MKKFVIGVFCLLCLLGACKMKHGDPVEYVEFWTQKVHISGINKVISADWTVNPSIVSMDTSQMLLSNAVSGKLRMDIAVEANARWTADPALSFDALGDEPQYEISNVKKDGFSLEFNIKTTTGAFTPIITLSVTDNSKEYFGTKVFEPEKLPSISFSGRDGHSVNVIASPGLGGEALAALSPVSDWSQGERTLANVLPGTEVSFDAIPDTVSGYSFDSWTFKKDGADWSVAEILNDGAMLQAEDSISKTPTIKMPAADVIAIANFKKDGEASIPALTEPSSVSLDSTGLAQWTWNPGSAEEPYLSSYEIDIWKSSKEQDILVQQLIKTTTVSGTITHNIHDELVYSAQNALYGDGDYYFAVQALSNDHAVYSDSYVAISNTQTVAQLTLDIDSLSWGVNTANSVSYMAGWDAATPNAALDTYTAKLYLNKAFVTGSEKSGLVNTYCDYTQFMSSIGTYYFSVKAIAKTDTLYYDSDEQKSPTQSIGGIYCEGFDASTFPEDASLKVTRNNGKPVSASPNSLSLIDLDTITFEVQGSPASVLWLVDKVNVGNAAKFTFKASSFDRGTYSISVRATIKGKEYSATARVRVEL
ncbi:MAG: hypothetical protein LBM77_08300 [Spirochaetaceae bacterium]|nr:hypothetical protein [Spirochaetaceae bacterium]